MDKDMYLIPANSKRSMLIFSLFRIQDLIIFAIGGFLTVILLFIIPQDSIATMVIKLLPVGITGFLILPVPNYHNVLVLIQEVVNYYLNRRIYIWKGWCFRHEYEDKK